MNSLQVAADEAMNHLDLVGVAADYDIKYSGLIVITDRYSFTYEYDDHLNNLMKAIAFVYPNKAPS